MRRDDGTFGFALCCRRRRWVCVFGRPPNKTRRLLTILPPLWPPLTTNDLQSPDHNQTNETNKHAHTQGDLDAAATARHLVPLKAAYLKLRFLADAGCVFVGHGLKADFRMTGLSVAPAQVRDTVELFCPSAGHRRLRLRFLAAYLLGIRIQGSEEGSAAAPLSSATAAAAAAGHDSVEDARTALKLYREWQRLRDAGELEAKLEEMYAWGKANGWEPPLRLSAARALDAAASGATAV